MSDTGKQKAIVRVQQLRMKYNILVHECKEAKLDLEEARDAFNKEPESKELREGMSYKFNVHHRKMRQMNEAWQKSQSLMREFGLTELNVITDTRRTSW